MIPKRAPEPKGEGMELSFKGIQIPILGTAKLFSILMLYDYINSSLLKGFVSLLRSVRSHDCFGFITLGHNKKF
jgi:hypothetical protein